MQEICFSVSLLFISFFFPLSSCFINLFSLFLKEKKIYCHRNTWWKEVKDIVYIIRLIKWLLIKCHMKDLPESKDLWIMWKKRWYKNAVEKRDWGDMICHCDWQSKNSIPDSGSEQWYPMWLSQLSDIFSSTYENRRSSLMVDLGNIPK